MELIRIRSVVRVNRNDVVTALTGCLDCTRSMKSQIVHISIPTAETILELLKKQEPVKSKQLHSNGGTWWYFCGACETAISPNDKYCRKCGRPVEWPEEQ